MNFIDQSITLYDSIGVYIAGNISVIRSKFFFKILSVNQLVIRYRSLPALVWHRQNWDIAFPVIEMDDVDLTMLKETSNYVAGVTDAAVEGR